MKKIKKALISVSDKNNLKIILKVLSKYKIIAVILSSILGPLTYFAGSPLGLININNLFLFFILMIVFWAILMIFYLSYLIKLKFN